MTSTTPCPSRGRAMPAHAAAALLLACAVAAAAEELPGTPACRAALQALERAEAALVAAAAASAGGVADADRRRDIAARLYPQRQRVADACLGGLTTSPSQRSGILPRPRIRPRRAYRRQHGRPSRPCDGRRRS